MGIKPLDRLMFAQGGLCFFCKQTLPKSEASVEHLVASSNGGSDNDENCVACCKAVNNLLGSMSLKEKIQVTLNQKGQFKCPNGVGAIKTTTKIQTPTATKPKIASPSTQQEDKMSLIITNLIQRGNSKPRTIKTLTSTIKTLFPKGLKNNELNSLIQQLETQGKIIIIEDKVTYKL